MSAGRGFVSLVGAGPGAADLLTLRAARRLAEADVVLYDALVDPRVLEQASRARLVDVGKRAGRHQCDQRVIDRLLVRLARRGWRVVRLKGGDPFVFGRGGEEALALARAGIPFEIVPGVSSAIAVPALAGVPVTHRGLATGFLVLSGHDPDRIAPIARNLPKDSVTVVLLMPRASRQTLAHSLLAAGWSPDTPAAVVQHGSLPEQSSWRGALSALANASDAALFEEGSAALVVVGPTVALAAELSAPGCGGWLAAAATG